MNVGYQVATPDVAISEDVTAFQGDLEYSLEYLKRMGFSCVEFMSVNPTMLDWEEISSLLHKYGMDVSLVCTGEVFGTLHYSLSDVNPQIRQNAISAIKRIIDFAAYLGANINIGRVIGRYMPGIPRETTFNLAVDALRDICTYAEPKQVNVAIETVSCLQTNFINTCSNAVEVIDAVNMDNIKLMMDIFHINFEEKDLLKSIEEYSKYNIHVHLCDSNRKYLGSGKIDFDSVIRKFKECNYNGAFIVETFQTPDQELAAKKTAEYIIPIINKYY